jgi:hypothetical protein
MPATIVEMERRCINSYTRIKSTVWSSTSLTLLALRRYRVTRLKNDHRQRAKLLDCVVGSTRDLFPALEAKVQDFKADRLCISAP